MNEREFVEYFTTEYSNLLNQLCLADRYKESLEFKKNLIKDTCNNKLIPKCREYFSKDFNNAVISDKTGLDFQHTNEGMFGWLHYMLKGDLESGVRRLLITLYKAI